MKRHLEFRDAKSAKFWEVEVKGAIVRVRYGRIGTEGRTSEKEHASPSEARKSAEKQLAAKVEKGYVPAPPKGPRKKAMHKKATPKKVASQKRAPTKLPKGGKNIKLGDLEGRVGCSWIKAHLDSCGHWEPDESVMLYEGDLEVTGDLVLDHRCYKKAPESDLGHVVVLGDLKVDGAVLNLEGDYGIGLFVGGKLEATHAIFGGSVGFINSQIRLSGYGMAFYNHGFVASNKGVTAKGLVHHDNRFAGKPTARTREAEWGAKGEKDAAKVLVPSLVDDGYPVPDRIIDAILAGEEIFRPLAELKKEAKAAEEAKAKRAAEAAARRAQRKPHEPSGPFGSSHIQFVSGVADIAYIVAKDGGVYRLLPHKDPELLHQGPKNPDKFVATDDGLFLVVGRRLCRSDKQGKRWTIHDLPEWKLVDIVPSGMVFVQTIDETLLVSRDGGTAFVEAKVPDTYRLYSIVAASKKTLFAAGHWAILRSDDGGFSWKLAKRAGGAAGVYAEAFAFNEKEILATGQWQSCALTVDGGKSWKAHKHPKELGVIHCLTRHADGRLFGLTGQKKPCLVVSKNLGRKWEPAAKNPRGVTSIWARPDGVLILVGKKGYFEIADGV
jgi:predicted DNA-binding WGR domain protein/photosystem II stability/assembly factor-like uncharacterized protein